jgi:Type II secretion system (T2SS), protein E, N-terminal domain
MIRIANLKIDPAAPEYLPESLAREECVLPLGLDGDALRVIFGRRVDYRESIDKIRFVLNRRLICAVADRERLERAIDEVYTHLATEVANCPLDFRFECPRRWLELRPTGQADVRFCESCARAVHLCADENEAIEHAQSGHCIAIYQAVGNDVDYAMGLVETIAIETEHAPTFLAALRAVEDPLVAGAAEGGEIYFLDTKVFDQGYMELCDYAAASNSNSPGIRSEMRQRREASYPFLGLPLIHGGLSHAGSSFNVFVDKTSGVVIHFEVHREPS